MSFIGSVEHMGIRLFTEDDFESCTHPDYIDRDEYYATYDAYAFVKFIEAKRCELCGKSLHGQGKVPKSGYFPKDNIRLSKGGDIIHIGQKKVLVSHVDPLPTNGGIN